jgi:pantoate--beta-alanine ligase
MKILLNNNDLNEALYGVSNLGFVPTMGSLHNGHISLIKKSLNKCNKTIVSIFVNPTQFNNKRDFRNYPRNSRKDLYILKKLKVDFIYMPAKEHVYNFKRKSKIKINTKDKILCAKYRKGHFEGVIDVMDRLIMMIKPKKIFMGEKDFQQLYLVKKYISNSCKAQIVTCKTIRDKNKLALSSRNSLLNKNELIKAGKIAKSLLLLKKKSLKKNINNVLTNKKKELSNLFNISIDYLELRNIYNLKKTDKIKKSKLFIAYQIKKVRLIDNF